LHSSFWWFCWFVVALRCSNGNSVISRLWCDEMRWGRKSEPTPLPTQGMFHLPHHLDMVWEKLAFDNSVSLHSGEIECSKVKCSASSGNWTPNLRISSPKCYRLS
jgi:hypothetical protein